MRLKVGDEFLDQDNSVIAQTFQVNQLGNISTRQGGFSNDFTLPLTAKNKALLGFPSNINSISDNPYIRFDVTLFDQGSPIATGYLRFTLIGDNTSLQVSFFSDNVNWYSLIKGKKMRDLNLSDFDHDWTESVIKTAIDADKSSGYTYPLIDYGEFASATITVNQISTKIRQIFPCMFYHTLLEQIYFDIGWKATGPVLDNNLFKRMVILFSSNRFAHTDRWQTDNTFTDSVTGASQAVPSGGAGTTITWTVSAGVNLVPGNVSEYTIELSLILSTTGTASVQVDIDSNFINAATRTAQVTGAATHTINLVFNNISTDTTAGEFTAINVNVSIFGGPTGAIISGTAITLTPSLEVFPTNEIQMSTSMPEMNQTDALNYIAVTFGAVLQANNNSKTVTWNYFRDIKNNIPNAVDWSDKIDLSKTRDVDFTQLLNDYGQSSIFKYKDDTSDDNLEAYLGETGESFGQGSIEIDNEHLPGEKVFYESPFAPTINEFSFSDSIYIPTINWVDGADGPKGQLLPRVAILSENIDLELYNGDISTLRIFNSQSGGAVVVNEIPFAWFAKNKYIDATDSLLDSLAYDQVKLSNPIGTPIIERFLEDYQNVLSNMKYLKAFFKLTEVDIANLDFTVPIYIEHFKSYFYLSKIKDFRGRNIPVECELVKIA